MINKVTEPAAVGVLTQALRAAALRHKVISNNLANVNTPGFKKSKVEFESLLADELKKKETDGLQMVRTHDKHFPLEKEREAIKPRIQMIEDTIMRVDQNNVDVDEETASLAKNNIYYNALARQVGDYYTKIRSVLTGQ